jgi:hypothetical protein
MPTDTPIHDIIRRLIGEEHTLRAERPSDPVGHAQRLQELQAQLDQCWDLLRQRGALRAVGADPDSAMARSSTRVQSYRG